MTPVTICSDYGAQEKKNCHCFYFSPLYLQWKHGTGYHDFSWFFFFMLSFKSAFSRSSFTLIKRFFSSSSLSTSRVVLSAYLKLLIFLPVIFIPVCVSSSLAFPMTYIAYNLSKQGDNIQPCHIPFPILNQSVVPCKVLIVASWSAYRLLKRQGRWYDTLLILRIFQFVVIHTVKDFSIVNEAEIGVFFFLEFPSFL